MSVAVMRAVMRGGVRWALASVSVRKVCVCACEREVCLGAFVSCWFACGCVL